MASMMLWKAQEHQWNHRLSEVELDPVADHFCDMSAACIALARKCKVDLLSLLELPRWDIQSGEVYCMVGLLHVYLVPIHALLSVSRGMHS